MSDDSVTVRTSQSWFSRIGSAIAGMLIGVFLFLVAFPLLSWNEGRAIKRAKTLEAGGSAVISVPAAPVEAANEGRLVHITGQTAVESTVGDPIFGITESAIKLRRNVEMYQWTEEKKSETKSKLGGGEETVTTYTYKKVWSDSLIDSSGFQKSQGHTNPGTMPLEGETFVADDVSVGDFILPDTLIAKINDYQPLPITQDHKTKITAEFSDPIVVSNNGFYVGQDPKTPVIGDLKINFEIVKPGAVSIVAGQSGKTFEPYIVKDLGSIELLQTGTFSAQSMFASEQQANTILTWFLRFVGFMMMFIGLALIAKPLAVVADVIPFFGSLADMGISLIALLIALPLTLGTIAVAWLAYRPLFGIPLGVLAIVSVMFGIRAYRKKKAAKPVAA